MTLQRVKVNSNDTEFKKVGNSMGWMYVYSKEYDGVIFTNGYEAIGGKCKPGQTVLFMANGMFSKFVGVEKTPKDPFKKALWEKGFKGSRFDPTLSNVSNDYDLLPIADRNFDFRQSEQEQISILIKMSPNTFVVRHQGKVLGVFIQGRDWSDHYRCQWWTPSDLNAEEKAIVLQQLS